MTEYPEPPVAGNEADTLVGALERQRAMFAWKSGDLTDAELAISLPPSTITLGGLLNHLALVEDLYFTHRLLGRDLGEPWGAMDRSGPDWDWRAAEGESAEVLYLRWQAAVSRGRAGITEALAAGGLDGLSPITWEDGRAPSMRRILMDIIEEYARHVGHADLIRESIDGRVGEDPPGGAYEYGTR